MQLFSLHHCLLFFILTFTLAPVSALEICPTRAKLHQPVTLSCTHLCSGSLMWNLYNKRDVVLARCDQKSCWSEKGFSISHDQYLKGEPSLTITEADYSKRNEYACECGDSDYALVRLVIETVFTPVQRKYDEDLKLKVSVPEPVEVIYKSGDAADEVICNVTKDSLQCKDDYRHRTSLTYPELTLKHMKPRDSGSYTIRDTKNNEDIQMYAVSVEDEPVPVWRIVLVVILLCFFVGAGMLGTFLLYKRHRRKQLKRRQQIVDQLVQDAEGGTEEKISEVEKSLDHLQQQYNNTVYEDKVKVFCSEMRRQLFERRQHQVGRLVQEAVGGTEAKIREAETSLDQFWKQYKDTEYSILNSFFCYENSKQLFERRQQQVDQLVQEAEGGTGEKISEVEKTLDELQQYYNNTINEVTGKEFCREKKKQLLNRRLQLVDQLVQDAAGGTEEKNREVEKTLDQLQQQYNNTEYKDKVKVFCSKKRRQLIKSHLLPLVQPLQKSEEWKKEDTERLERKLNRLMSLYWNAEHLNDVSLFCMEQRSQISWNRLQYSKEEPFMTKRHELNKKLLRVKWLVQQAKGGTEEKITEAEKAIVELEQQYSYTEYSKPVLMLCGVNRNQLNPLYRGEGLITCGKELYKQGEVVENLVQEANGGIEEKIRKAEEAISQLELKYFTEYSGRVSFFCMTKRAELFWYRLPQ